MTSDSDRAYVAYAVLTACVLTTSLLNLLGGGSRPGSFADAAGEMIRGLVIIAAPLALLAALIFSYRVRSDPIVLTLAAGGLLMVFAIAAEGALARPVVNTTGLVYGGAGLLLCLRWFLVRRR